MLFIVIFTLLFSQRSLEEAVGGDEYSTARKAVLTHLCARPMQVCKHIVYLIGSV